METGYAKGFRDGAAEACQAEAKKIEDAIAELKADTGPATPQVYSRERVIEILQLLIRQNQSLAARIAAVGTNPRDRSEDGNEDEGEDQPG